MSLITQHASAAKAPVFTDLSIPCISDYRIAATLLTRYSDSTIRNLIELDRGPPGSNMTTLGLAYPVSSDKVYRMTNGMLETVIPTSSIDVIDMEERASNPCRMKVPPHLEIDAKWDEKPAYSGKGNNILGDNGVLTLEADSISIPEVEATDEMLAYYGATLIDEGELIQFPDEQFPLFLMDVGEGYVSNTLMTDSGGGFYLEYHHDAPHFHMPIQGGGHYILARWNEDHTKLQITGFKIPDKKAIYSKKGAIHCDASLTGRLVVGYTDAKECSTVTLQNKDGKRTEVSFI